MIVISQNGTKSSNGERITMVDTSERHRITTFVPTSHDTGRLHFTPHDTARLGGRPLEFQIVGYGITALERVVVMVADDSGNIESVTSLVCDLEEIYGPGRIHLIWYPKS